MADPSTTIELQELLDRFAAGDPAAKNDLINRAYGRLMVVTRRLLGSFLRVRAEEETTAVLHEAYLRLHASLDEVRPATVRQFMGLASLAIRRVLLDYVRRLRGRGKDARPARVRLDARPGGDTPGPAFDVPDTDAGQDQVALVIDLLEAVEKLPEEEREVVGLLFFHGCTQPEAGAILGVHEDTVKRRWSRARVQLADRLAAFGGG
jgi:RNA polymerase sigma factor (TIGR02999 family)